MTNVGKYGVNLSPLVLLAQESYWCRVGLTAYLTGGELLAAYLPTYRVVYPAVMTVSCRHVVSCRDGPLRHDTIGST
jgi:hypothetical protein